MPFSATHRLYMYVLTKLMNLDIDRAINNRYAFCSDGGANLHTKFSETHQITLKIILMSPLTLKIWVQAYADTLIVSLSVILTKL